MGKHDIYASDGHRYVRYRDCLAAAQYRARVLEDENGRWAVQVEKNEFTGWVIAETIAGFTTREYAHRAAHAKLDEISFAPNGGEPVGKLFREGEIGEQK